MFYIYKVERTDSHGYEEFDSQIVAAPNERMATLVYPIYGYMGEKSPTFHETKKKWLDEKGNDTFSNSWTTPTNLAVTKLGIADESITKTSCLLASFNAG